LFLIRTKVCVSQIHGIGCFAGEAVEGGTVVWQFHPVVDVYYSAAQILAMPSAFQIFLSRYASKDFGVDRYVLCTDNARFINHAETPNMSHSSNTILANRDIAAGEELTLNYQFVDDPNEAGNILTQIGLTSGDWDDLDPRIKSARPRPC